MPAVFFLCNNRVNDPQWPVLSFHRAVTLSQFACLMLFVHSVLTSSHTYCFCFLSWLVIGVQHHHSFFPLSFSSLASFPLGVARCPRNAAHSFVCDPSFLFVSRFGCHRSLFYSCTYIFNQNDRGVSYHRHPYRVEAQSCGIGSQFVCRLVVVYASS